MNLFSRKRRNGYTLIEVMVSFTIFTILGGMILVLIIGVNRSLFDSQNKTSIEINFRSTTSALTPAISSADLLLTYNSQSDLTPVPPNQAGDYLVAVYYQNPGTITAGGAPDLTVSRIVGVCRIPNADGAGPVYMFDSMLNDWGLGSGPLNITWPAKLPSLAQIQSFKKLAGSAYPIAAQAGGKGIFVNNNSGNGVTVLTLLREGSPGKYVSNSYSYSISSRNL